ncbi:hypothetical protein IQ243_09420 [Nostocales cyanobacterium LEGE 11386]|nr:hypothetical protein [Nostocales cyanobacterium LEGE 11386]
MANRYGAGINQAMAFYQRFQVIIQASPHSFILNVYIYFRLLPDSSNW